MISYEEMQFDREFDKKNKIWKNWENSLKKDWKCLKLVLKTLSTFIQENLEKNTIILLQSVHYSK